MILGSAAIRSFIERGEWIVHREGERIRIPDLHVNPNSVDVTLGKSVLEQLSDDWVDPERPESVRHCPVPLTETGHFYFLKGHSYLGYAAERFDTGCIGVAPIIEGRSTLGRLFLSIHSTAGFGDVGFKGNFTLELSYSGPSAGIRLRPGHRIAQIAFHVVREWEDTYRGAYSSEHDDRPVPPVLGIGRV